MIDTIQGVYAQYAVSIDRLLQIRQEQRQLDRKQAQWPLADAQSRKAQLDERLQDLRKAGRGRECPRGSFGQKVRRKRKFPHGLGAGCKISGATTMAML